MYRYFNNIRWNYYILLLLIFVVLPGLFLGGFFSVAKAAKEIVFTYPEKELTQLEFDTEEVIQGYIKYPPSQIESAQISFDGQIWRNVEQVNGQNANYFYWQYPWTVAGKGRSFMVLQAITVEEKVIQERMLIDVYVPPEKESTENVYDLLNRIRSENAKKSENEDTIVTSSYLSVIDFVLEEHFGNFLVKNWQVLLPTIEQQQFLLDSIWETNLFIKKYPAGIDIMIFVTLPYILLLSLITVFVIIFSWWRIWESWRYWIHRLTTPRQCQACLTGILYDVKSKSTVALAEIVIRNTNHKTYRAVTSWEGNFSFHDIPAGEYTYEVHKYGFKEYVLDEPSQKYFRDIPLLYGSITIDCQSQKIVLAAERIVDVERSVNTMKSEYWYLPQKWFWQNINPIFTIGLIFGLMWMFFTDHSYINYYLLLLFAGYVLYRKVLRIKNPWGRVVSPLAHLYDNIELHLIRDGEIYDTTWTDWKGRFSFGEVDSGKYMIGVANRRYKIALNSPGTYQGEEVYISNNEDFNQRPINIILIKND